AVPISGIPPPKINRRLDRVVEVSTVYEKDVQQPIVVVIEKGDAGPHSFDQVPLRRGRIPVDEIQARGVGDFEESSTAISGQSGGRRSHGGQACQEFSANQRPCPPMIISSSKQAICDPSSGWL